MTDGPSFSINGRFLVQSVTGVQRYAANVVKAIDISLMKGSKKGNIIVPFDTQDLGFQNLSVVTARPLNGHAWEQLVLARLSQGRLLNLCNTAPALKRDQIVCIHDANVFASPDSYSRSFRGVYQALQPMLTRRSARIATVSHAAARQIARHLPVSLNDIVVLPNGHEHSLAWDPRRAQIAPSFLEERALGTGRPFILALGSRARHKNLSMLIGIAPCLDAMGVNLVVVGGSDGIFTPNSHQVCPNVHFTGRVSDDDLAYLLEKALCLAFPSLTEGFGLPIVEAMARGCPVIASDCASMPEVCGEAALLASPNEPTGWIQHVKALQQSNELRADLVGRGYQQIRNFSWLQTAAGYLDLLERPMSMMRAYRPLKQELPRATVVVATRGRPEVVSATVRYILTNQTLAPDAVIISCVHLADAGDLTGNPAVTVLTGPPGLAAQRNTALAHLPTNSEIVVFFDDDFIADRNWLAAAAATLRDESQVVGLSGRVIADGINGPAISFDEGVKLIESAQAGDWTWIEPYSPYGCNMAFRVSAIGETRFDERLVLYGWLEDRDFGAALAKRGGRLIKSADAVGLHMGVKGGRVNGERLGYSQIVNPIYMKLKGTMSLKRVFTHIAGNMLSNIARSPWPEPFVDRRGRLKGNFVAIFDVLRGRIQPERAATLSSFKNGLKVNTEVHPR
jgi:glycosyltransferase involved in cell wall biosynthesis